ncbi:nitroreductase family protein [Desulfatibacillum aliphaticivorans]|uniref:Nitroreductase n=1 Tax=Desulfatibacillum aliphaticivorans TaxID=218208 RepID=B8FBF0_DESAL|nr:nitroreductase family protein [Desulfatibacillum aliphaticivorans]ACL04594.1 nitroreductase [Desulfatibacillum aliphaticivorans]
MSEMLKLIKERRSVRRYLDKEVDEAMLQQVLESVQWSPSWANTQVWEIVVVKNPEIKEKLAATLGKGNPAAKAMVEAPLVLVVCGKKNASGFYKDQVTTKFGDWMLFDLGIATQSLCLTARSLGLGTVVVGLFDQDAAGKVVNLPDGMELVAMVPMGHIAKDSGAPKRKEISDFVHQDTF